MKAVTLEILEAVFQPDVLSSMRAALQTTTPASILDWWGNHIAPEFRNRIQFPGNIAKRHGGQSLADTPQVTVGTIHSVQGRGG